MPFTKKTAREAGLKGGMRTKQIAEENPEYYYTIGLTGGHRLLDIKGKEYYSRLGKMSAKLKKEAK